MRRCFSIFPRKPGRQECLPREAQAGLPQVSAPAVVFALAPGQREVASERVPVHHGGRARRGQYHRAACWPRELHVRAARRPRSRAAGRARPEFKPGRPVPLVGRNTLERVIALYTLLEARVPVLLIHPKLTESERAAEIAATERAVGTLDPTPRSSCTRRHDGQARGALLTRSHWSRRRGRARPTLAGTRTTAGCSRCRSPVSAACRS